MSLSSQRFGARKEVRRAQVLLSACFESLENRTLLTRFPRSSRHRKSASLGARLARMVVETGLSTRIRRPACDTLMVS